MRPRPARRLPPALVTLLAPAVLHAQGVASGPPAPPSGPLWDSYQQAAAVVRAALVAHGGEAAVRGLTAASYRWEGQDYSAGQGRVPSAAWDTAGNARPAAEDVRVDLARGRFVWDRLFHFPGGYLNAIRVAADGRTLVAYNPDPRRGMGGTTFERDTTGAAARRVAFTVAGTMPVLLLREALLRASTLRYVGSTGAAEAGGRREDAVGFTGPNGEAVTLYVDAATHLVSRQEDLGVGTLGDEVDAIRYSDYRTVGGLAVPYRAELRWNGLFTGVRRLAAFAPSAAFDSAFTAVPAGYVPAAPPAPPAAVRVADGVYYLERLGGGYRMLVVDTDQGVLVVDPPLAAPVGEAALAMIERTLPGRPVRWVVLTHPHSDHMGGLAPFAARGATVLVAPGSEAYVRRMLAVPQTVGRFGADRGGGAPAAPAPPPLALRAVRGTLVVGTGARGGVQVRVLDVSPTAHAAAMLAVHVPAARLLFQGDLLRVNAHGGPVVSPEATRDLARVVRRFAPDVRIIGAVHGENSTVDDLRAVLRAANP